MAQATELSDQERQDLAAKLDMKVIDARSLGFGIRGQQYGKSAVVAQVPQSLDGADVSVCGVKGFMIDEHREFQTENGSTIVIPCAVVAMLEMTDAPVHVHAATQEQYIVLEGNGKMVLGEGGSERIFRVGPGSIVFLPPGEPHGIVSVGGKPIKAVLIFTPGLAPKSHPQFRDEKIIHERTSERLKQLTSA